MDTLREADPWSQTAASMAPANDMATVISMLSTMQVQLNELTGVKEEVANLRDNVDKSAH